MASVCSVPSAIHTIPSFIANHPCFLVAIIQLTIRARHLHTSNHLMINRLLKARNLLCKVFIHGTINMGCYNFCMYLLLDKRDSVCQLFRKELFLIVWD